MRAVAATVAAVRRVLFLSLVLFAATAHAQLTENVAARSDPAQTYTLYLPSSYDAAKKPPTLLIFDPRQRGTSAAEIFRAAAEEYGWILISSNETRSDGETEPNDRAVNALLPEVSRYSTGRIYATGFSGTAMLAWAVGIMTGKLAGVIGVGGRLVAELPPAKFNFAHYGFAGERDFNNREMRLIEEILTREGKHPHRFQAFDGAHNWITPALAREALGWFEVVARNERVAAKVFAEDVAAADALRGLVALRRYRVIATTYDGLQPVETIRAKIAQLENDAAVKRELADEKKWDAYEQQFLRDISARLPMLRGGSAADVLRAFRVAEARRHAAREGAEGAAGRRIMEDVFVQCAYLLPRQLIARRDFALAEALLTVAAEIYPDRAGVQEELARVRKLASPLK